MWNSIVKPERGHAQVSGISNDHGRLTIRLTSPSHGRAFFYARLCNTCVTFSWRRRKGNIMVVCAVQELGKVRPVCFARSMLSAASDSLEAGDAFKAGYQLREAVSRYLTAMCEAHNCKPRKKHPRTSGEMARALFKGGGIDRGIYDWLREIIDCADLCARWRISRSRLIKTSISLMHFMLDNSPEINLPERAGGAI